jgi:DNA-binding transcriptional MerR regulator
MVGATLRIGDVARRAGVSADTIRYYERLGVLPRPPRTNAGYRQYSASAVDRVLLVRNALRFGFSLRDLSRFFRTRGAGDAPCREVRASAARILAEVDRQIVELTAAREAIRRTLDDWDHRLDRTPANRPAHLLESLPSEAALPLRGRRSSLKAAR